MMTTPFAHRVLYILAFVTTFDVVLPEGSGKNETKLYTWNKSVASWWDYQQSFCPRRCRDGQVERIHDIECSEITCYPCTCKRPDCELYGTCCPDISEPFIPPSPQDDVNVSTSNYVNNALGVKMNSFSTSTPYTSDSPTHWTMPITESLSTTSLKFEGRGMKGSEATSENGSPIEVIHKAKCIYHSKRHGFRYVKSCASNFSTSNISSLCETGLPWEEEISVQTYAYVTDLATRMTYNNKYCAACNYVNKFVPWQIQIVCDHFMQVYQATSVDELLRASWKSDSTCIVRQDPPANVELIACDDTWDNKDDKVIDICNSTGRWSEYDEDVVRGCEMLTGRRYRVSYIPSLSSLEHNLVPTYYKNIFCAICNQDTYPKYTNCEPQKPDNNTAYPDDYLSYPDVPLPFSMLLGFRNDDKQSDDISISATCRDTEWASQDDHCFPLRCTPGKLLVNKTCVTGLDQIKGLGYHLRLWYFPRIEDVAALTNQVQASSKEAVLDDFLRKVHDLQSALSTSYLLKGELVMNTSAMADPEPHSGMPQTSPPGTQRGNVSNVASVVPHLFRLDVNLTANDTLGRDQFEQILLESFLSQDIEMHITEKITVNFKPVVTLGSSDPQSYCSYIATASPDLVCYSKSKSYDPIDGFVYASWWTPFLNVTYSLTCAYVSFDPLLYVIRETFAAFRPKVIVTIDLNVTTITLSEPSELKMLAVDDSGSLNVCHELLDLKIVSTRSSEMDDLTLAQYILTLVCVNVSMLCLLLTLMTYIRFPSLRNMAGRNNMGLCSSLLFAQASMLASARVEDTGPWCTALGISTHFLWLCMFGWSFICCFHMFRVFTAKTRLVHVTARSQLRLLLKNIAMSLLIPGLIVGTVIVTSYFSSNGDVIGYGDNKCYLDSTFLVGVAMIAPLAITTLCNMTFFFITILKIHNVRKLQQHDSFKKDDHKNLYIYIKLSTMTGLFWTVFIIAEGADVDVLRFIAVIANGLQGVFIFVSYICNKRILHLYLHSIGLKPEITSSADGKRVKTDRSALGNLAYERRKQVSRDEEADETLPDCPGKEAGDGRRSEAEHDHTD